MAILIDFCLLTFSQLRTSLFDIRSSFVKTTEDKYSEFICPKPAYRFTRFIGEQCLPFEARKSVVGNHLLFALYLFQLHTEHTPDYKPP